MLYKALPAAGNTKDVDLSKRTAVLSFATYKSLDRDQDRANKGMFTKSWNESFDDIRFFLNHDKKQAPGRNERFWEDDDHAYSGVKLGTHTLGVDTLKMMDEGIITNVSYGFDPDKTAPIKGKGKDLKEVKLWEVSVLTHWGAHPGSSVIGVQKALKAPSFDTKALSGDEQEVLQRIIANSQDSLEAAIDLAAVLTPDSDLYTYVMYIISRAADQMGDLRCQLRYGMKELKELRQHIGKMKSFVKNTTASDETIVSIQTEIKSAEELLQSYDTASTHDDDDQDEPAVSANKEFADALALLTLKF